MAIMRKDEPQTDRSITVGQVHTILGPESSFEGKLSFQGTVRIDGRFSGEVVTNDVLVVGEGAVGAEPSDGAPVFWGGSWPWFSASISSANALEKPCSRSSSSGRCRENKMSSRCCAALVLRVAR